MSVALWLVFFYVLGGLTFVPSLVLAIVLYFYWTLPKISPENNPSVLYDQVVSKEKNLKSSTEKLNSEAYNDSTDLKSQQFSRPGSVSSMSDAASLISRSNPASPNYNSSDISSYGISHLRTPSTSLSLDREHETGVDAYFTGTLVVSREYFIYPTGGPNNSGNPPAPASHQASMNQSESAYSTLYKLINNSLSKSNSPSPGTFSSSNAPSPTPSFIENSSEGGNNGSSTPKSTTSSSTTTNSSKKSKLTKYHAILRHGNLFLYEDSDHEILKHVIVIAHHLVTIWPPHVPDGELFAKRSAICLVKIPYSHGSDAAVSDVDVAEILADSSTPPKNAFYLYSDSASEKEDFYFALIRASKRHSLRMAGLDNKPVSQFNPVYMAHPLHHRTADMMDLINTLHSTDSNIQTRWLNAFIGRIFLAIKDTPQFTSALRNKISTKLTRIKRPTYLSEIHVTKLSCGNALPYFTNPKLIELTPEGKLTVESDVTYDGKFSVQITTKAKLNLGARFKAREVTIALAITLEHLEGKLIFRVKPPPSDRIWYTFESMPKMSLFIEPVVSSRQIKYSVVTKAIENKLRESVCIHRIFFFFFFFLLY